MPAIGWISGLTLLASLGRLMYDSGATVKGARSRARRWMSAALAAGALGLLWFPVASPGDLSHDLSARSHTATQLRASIAAETRRINATGAGLRDARARLAAIQSRLDASEAQLASVQRDVVATRKRLEHLENRLHDASVALAASLRGAYEDPEPDVVTVVLESRGFTDMLERLSFLERVRRHDGAIVSNTKTARVQVLRQTEHLQRLEIRYRVLTASILNQRNTAAAIQGALLTRQAEQIQQRANTSAKLSAVKGQIASIRHRIAVLNRPPAPTATSTPVQGLALDVGGMAQAPPGAPTAVKQVIAAGNAIAGLPYLYGGGHGSFHASAYDCSGSVSYALAAAGLLSSPLDSTAFESWGEAGAGRWITVYANAGHAFMVVAGWRFDTGALSSGGTRWSRSMRDTSGFVARHPAGL